MQTLQQSGFDPRILRHSGIWGAADEAVLNIVHKHNEASSTVNIEEIQI